VTVSYRFPHRWTRGLVLALLLGALTGAVHPAHAQELNCSVNVNYSQLSGSDFAYLDELQQRIREYLNERTWTEDRFLEYERISCSFQIIMTEAISLSEFRARLIVTSDRPIYGTAQSTTVLRLNDEDWRFEYSRGTPLVFDLDQYSPLTSVLDFYAYIILGYDYDTFSELGGTPYFEQARRIADRAQSAGGAGWSSVSNDRSRTDLIAELLDARFRPLRVAYRDYHLRGLDRFVDQTTPARQTVLDVVEQLRGLEQEVSRAYTIDLFFSTKYQELTAIFEDSSVSDRAYNLLSQADPSHSSTYNRLVN
jgi:hypothetical protein